MKPLIRIKESWKILNTATKVLVFIALACLFHTIFAVFFDNDHAAPSDVAIRSIMSSIFGYIFGSQVTENSNIENKKTQTIIASIVAILCLVVAIASHWLNVNQISASAVELRNLLFSAVGFLLGRAKGTE